MKTFCYLTWLVFMAVGVWALVNSQATFALGCFAFSSAQFANGRLYEMKKS